MVDMGDGGVGDAVVEMHAKLAPALELVRWADRASGAVTGQHPE